MALQADARANDQGTSPPHTGAQFITVSNGQRIRIPRGGSLNHALAAVAATGIIRLDFTHWFHGDGYTSCRITYQRATGGPGDDKRTVERVCTRVKELMEAIVYDACDDWLEFDERLDLNVSFASGTRRPGWAINGSGNVVPLIEEVSDAAVGVK